MYKVEFQDYVNDIKFNDTQVEFNNALVKAEKLCVFTKNWSRHNSVQGVIQHLDNYSDLYNEGHIIITKIKE